MKDKDRIPTDPAAWQAEIEQAVAGDLANLTLRELLGMLLTRVATAERSLFLEQRSDDKANGFYGRRLQLGSTALDLAVPRTRSGDFRPSILPDHWQRAVPEERQRLLLGLLASARSVNAAKESLRQMGLSHSEPQLQAIADELCEDFELRRTGPVETDLLALFLDAKAVEIRDADRLRAGTIYVAVGLGRDGRKRVVACEIATRRENTDDWKRLLRGLIERGLRRVLIVVQDDFSGLLPITRGLFPDADIQLCFVHMQRNVGHHLDKQDAAAFQQRLRTIRNAYDSELGGREFEQLCAEYADKAPAFIAALRRKKDHYLAFLDYPEAIRKTLSTTNAVEAVNGGLERVRINNGGYFHSQRMLSIKLQLAIANLEQRRWKRPAANTAAALHQLNAMFERRFETES